MTELVERVSGEVVDYGSLEENEQVIQRGMTSFVEVGRALARIRDDRQYVMAGSDTFEDYCRERWDLGRTWADHQIRAARLVELTTRVGIDPPQTEFQARPLARVLNEHGEEAAVRAWSAIVDAHEGEGPITGREVARFLKLGGTKANYGKPGWHELLGDVGDTLIAADKKLAKVEDALTRTPNQNFRARAGRYASDAEALAQRLRFIEDSA